MVGALVVSGGVAAWHFRAGARGAEDDSARDQETESDPAQEPESTTFAETLPAPEDEPPRGEDSTLAETASSAVATTSVSPPRHRPWKMHSADPCGPVLSDDGPSAFAKITAQGVTVMWPDEDDPLPEPTAFAYLVAGLLEEAALLTGTERRAHVTVIVYPTSEMFHLLSGAPSWADGLYSGAVHLPSSTTVRDFGVRLSTLRHELMHAQLHSAVGCMPFWFNEGVAMRFGGRPPTRPWIRMLRERTTLDFESLEEAGVLESTRSDMDLAYAQSLAMVLLLEERSPEDAIEGAVADLEARRGRPRSEVIQLWRRLRPEVSRSDLLGSLARRVFGMPLGPDLTKLFRESAVCCFGSSRIKTFGCRGAPLQPGKHIWTDESRVPYALCEVD